LRGRGGVTWVIADHQDMHGNQYKRTTLLLLKKTLADRLNVGKRGMGQVGDFTMDCFLAFASAALFEQL
jgi:hypothetical protein